MNVELAATQYSFTTTANKSTAMFGFRHRAFVLTLKPLTGVVNLGFGTCYVINTQLT